MHNDLLDTVLVSRKDATVVGDSTADMKESTPAPKPAGEEAKCPVDHKTREAWVQQARSSPSQATTAAPSGQATGANQAANTSSWASWLRLPYFSQPAQSQESSPSNASAARSTPRTFPQLDESRVISSIPRSSDPGPSACPVNHEQETGTSASGHWVYPSEKQFFEAMKRKGYSAASAADMKTVVPIHNAVNEKAWAEILKWEAPYIAPINKGGCGGPRLHSFAGLSQTMSPRARINTLLGYTAPFDRHDWVVDRCGKKVEYIIDFYAGRNDGAGAGKLNFYLDVRPKLNTWEGIKMRALRATGLA